MGNINTIRLSSITAIEVDPVNIRFNRVPATPDTNVVVRARRFDSSNDADTGVDIAAQVATPSGNVVQLKNIWLGSETPALGNYRINLVLRTADSKVEEEVNLLRSVVAGIEKDIIPAANAIVSIERVRRYLNIPEGEGSSDDFLQESINAVSDSIEKYTLGPVVVQTYSNELCDGDGSGELITKYWPVVALANDNVADLQWRPSPDQAWINIETDKSFILVGDPKPWYVRLWRLTFLRGYSNIKISYKAGYTVIPEDLKIACVERVAEMYAESKVSKISRLGRTSVAVNFGNGSQTDSYMDLWSDRHQAILRRYRRWRP